MSNDLFGIWHTPLHPDQRPIYVTDRVWVKPHIVFDTWSVAFLRML